MASYSMVGSGNFGGTSNFLGQLGSIARPWGDAMTAGMNMGSQFIDYQNKVNLNPSAVNAQIAQNVNAKDVAEGDHYANYMMNSVLSKLAGGKLLEDYQKQLLNSGVVNLGSGVNKANLVGSVQGTPTQTQPNATPATTQAQPVQQPVAGRQVGESDILSRLMGIFGN